jgi:hypothetical protein
MSWTAALSQEFVASPKAAAPPAPIQRPHLLGPPRVPLRDHSAYAAAALSAERASVENAPEGERNHQLNISAMKLGQLAAAGVLDEDEALDELASAARNAGLGDAEIKSTLRSGWKKGLSEPRELPDSEPSGCLHGGVWAPQRVVYPGTPAASESPTAAPAQVEWRNAQAIFAPLPPTRWVSQDLHLCPGRPTLLAAYGASGKTLALQSLALSIAADKPIWEHFSSTRGAVKHFDHEQGWHATSKRYQRLSLGMGIVPPELDERLFVAVFPHLYLNSQNAVDAYCRACDGAAVVILDALRGATPGQDENDSKIRICLDNLTRVSEKIGACFIVIHHAGKPKEGHSDVRTVVRGSSAIFDACGTVYVMTGAKGMPKLVTEQKAPAEAEGSTIEDFQLEIQDVLVGMNPTGGVKVVYQPATGGRKLDAAAVFEADAQRILEYVRQHPGESARSVRAKVGVNTKRAADVIHALVEAGRLVESRRTGQGGGSGLSLPSGSGSNWV